MLQLAHMNRIVEACYPCSRDEAIRLWHDIQPVKFGNSILWQMTTNTVPAIFANYAVPSDSPYLLILRTECITTTFDSTAVGFGQHAPPPPALAAWVNTDLKIFTGDFYRVTPTIPIHLLCDAEEFIFTKGGDIAALVAALAAPPDQAVRYIRTTVYAYLIGALVADKLGTNESTYFGATAENINTTVPVQPVPPPTPAPPPGPVVTTLMATAFASPNPAIAGSTAVTGINATGHASTLTQAFATATGVGAEQNITSITSAIWGGFGSALANTTAITLNVTVAAQVTATNDGSGPATSASSAGFGLEYSLNGGVTYTQITQNTGGNLNQTFAIPLPATQDPSLVRVRETSSANAFAAGSTPTATHSATAEVNSTISGLSLTVTTQAP